VSEKLFSKNIVRWQACLCLCSIHYIVLIVDQFEMSTTYLGHKIIIEMTMRNSLIKIKVRNNIYMPHGT
jgi:hypothetical protein